MSVIRSYVLMCKLQTDVTVYTCSFIIIKSTIMIWDFAAIYTLQLTRSEPGTL
jgi:hypothetical protein